MQFILPHLGSDMLLPMMTTSWVSFARARLLCFSLLQWPAEAHRPYPISWAGAIQKLSFKFDGAAMRWKSEACGCIGTLGERTPGRHYNLGLCNRWARKWCVEMEIKAEAYTRHHLFPWALGDEKDGIWRGMMAEVGQGIHINLKVYVNPTFAWLY